MFIFIRFYGVIIYTMSNRPKSILLAPRLLQTVNPTKSDDKLIANLIVHGQGVFIFDYNHNNDTIEHSNKQCSFCLYNKLKDDGLAITFKHNEIIVKHIKNDVTLIDVSNNTGLSHHDGAYYWFSVDSQNQSLYAGVGEARLETCVYRYQYSVSDDDLRKKTKAFLESMVSIHFTDANCLDANCMDENHHITPIKLLRDPITQNVPMIVKDTDSLTMNDIASGLSLPKSNLSVTSQILFDCISGKKFILDDPDFPDFSKAIEYSIATPGCWCNKRLAEKSTEFNKDKPNILETYLRITLGQNNGESPGIPYVMEIWPVGHFSPIHSHAGASAIIRVLHGKISVGLFAHLCCEKDSIPPFSTAEFVKDDITWISPTLNQTHQLTNLTTNSETCITIQCYMYENDNNSHYDYFDYIDANGAKQQYEPGSDMDFVKFKQLMRDEWNERIRQRSVLSRLLSIGRCTN